MVSGGHSSGGHSSGGHSTVHTSSVHESTSHTTIPFTSVHGGVAQQQDSSTTVQQPEYRPPVLPDWVGAAIFGVLAVLILVLLYNVVFGDWEKR